jgi:uncharacterized protein YgbK (DUF1537 family)
MAFLLGCIADDYTGATDVANMLVRGGMRTVQWFGVPPADVRPPDADAVVVALKSRCVPAQEAVAVSVAALDSLQSLGARRFLLKYCSTFDSTPQGNIGPVAEALQARLHAGPTICCPAFPENGRTVYLGHLFVQGRMLNESGMERHPLNPMRDPDLVRVLQQQASQRVGLLPYSVVSQGPQAITAALAQLRQDGLPLVIVDALDEEHLRDLARAVADAPLVTGGSGIARWLAEAYARTGQFASEGAVAALPQADGFTAVLSGSCSPATRRQVDYGRQRWPAWPIDVRAALLGESAAAQAIEWAGQRLPAGPVLIYSTAEPEELAAIQRELGQEAAAAAVERTLAAVARGLVGRGVRRLVVAGGETSGAVVRALDVQALRIGPQIDPGVPWTETLEEPRIALALKSGNFGSDDFFEKALEMLP